MLTTLILAAPVLFQSGSDMDSIAEAYVQTVLALGQHDPDYVDSYYGPAAWRTQAEASKRPLDAIKADAAQLIARLQAMPPPADPMRALRHQYLLKQLASLVSRAAVLLGARLSFDAEAKAYFDVVPPTFEEEHFRALRAELGALLPGDGSLLERYQTFRNRHVIPADKLDQVFQAAIAEGRARTKQHLALPDGESFRVEYVKDKPWSAYNWYQGKYQSLIQVNVDLPIYIDRAIDLACHEGYPGHHVYQVMLEQHLVNERKWIEFTVYPLFSPQSLISEGSANYGIEMVFPERERIEFARRVLYPLAQLDPAGAEKYEQVLALVAKLSYADNEAARRYLDGAIDKAAAQRWLEEYALLTPALAERRVRFIERYRSYVINYNLGKDLVRRFVERSADRWKTFGDLLASPRLPSGL
ncbi:MAG: hypothetical protein U1E76_22790 [Planctomycetota bacterium]